ncbi:MAG TPA: DoxX family protein [Vicinamibacterales bacterium]|nr:DoxX family protein [Vicinamibacterales bacterium]
MATQRLHPAASNAHTTIFITETHVNAALLMIGRLIFGGFWVYSGLNHLMHYSTMAVYTAARGVPEAQLAVIGTGALLVAGGISILTGVAPKIGALFIGIFLIGVTPIMHAFWNDITPAERAADVGNFAKNVALLGATLFVAALPEPWPVSPHKRIEIEE